MTIRNLRLALKRCGATLERDGDGRDYRVYQCVAPAGYVWQDTGGPHLVVTFTERLRGDEHRAVEDAIQRVACGLVEEDEDE